MSRSRSRLTRFYQFSPFTDFLVFARKAVTLCSIADAAFSLTSCSLSEFVQTAYKTLNGASKLGNFRYNYVVHHNFSRAEPCIYDDNGKEICTLDTTFVDGYILIEEHKCCCRSGYCAVILYDQSEMVLPVMKTVVDLTEVSPMEGVAEAIREAGRIKRGKARPQPPMSMRMHGLRRIPYDCTFTGLPDGNSEAPGRPRPFLIRYWAGSGLSFRAPVGPGSYYYTNIRANTTILIVWPLFLILICLFCAVGFFNICRDDLMDELHSSGIDVIRSEEGGVRQAPREYEY
ncbi:hypothetical protein Y032_0030g2051 [Ancylostoma ceylanicum]|uniref:Uncharacterized protein n=1 Tax=Ancylostoma ceylanicum TaxID=53326 RepID=A0A016URJ1_9BILA|nr:hypothetical protein Y032_0030g2051 [Ancylostoma ceylanicum]